MNFLEPLAPYRKAIVPGVVAFLLLLLNQLGVTDQMTVREALGVIVTAFFVYWVPNKR